MDAPINITSSREAALRCKNYVTQDYAGLRNSRSRRCQAGSVMSRALRKLRMSLVGATPTKTMDVGAVQILAQNGWRQFCSIRCLTKSKKRDVDDYTYLPFGFKEA